MVRTKGGMLIEGRAQQWVACWFVVADGVVGRQPIGRQLVARGDGQRRDRVYRDGGEWI